MTTLEHEARDGLKEGAKAALDALSTAAREAPEAPEAPRGDPHVMAAIRLGWLVEDVLAGRGIAPLDGEPFADDATSYRAQGVRLEGLADALDLPTEGLRAASAELGSGHACQNTHGWPDAVEGLLLGRDARLARGFLLGRGLNRLRHSDYSRTRFGEPDLPRLVTRLDQLSSALPPHAARGVADSLRRWCRFDHAKQSDEDVAHTGALVRGQCDLWYRIVTGQKDPVELLEPANYWDAALSMARRTATTGVSLLVRIWPLTLAVGVLIALGVAGLLIGLDGEDSPVTAAGLTALISGFGLTWKGIGGALGKIIAPLEAPLRGATLDSAVTDAVTLLHYEPPREPTVRQRRKTVEGGDYAERAERTLKLTP